MALLSRFTLLIGFILSFSLAQTDVGEPPADIVTLSTISEEASMVTASASEAAESGEVTSEPTDGAASEVASEISSGVKPETSSSSMAEQEELPTSSFASLETEYPDMNENTAATSARDPGFVALTIGIVLMCGGMMILV